MVTNPHTLSENIRECPADCPFLGMRTFMPNTVPFYCNQYDTFLGGSALKQALRCANCRGVEPNIVEAGLAFMDAYPIDHYTLERNKQAFMKLDYGFQKMFVDLVAKTGAQIILEADEEDSPEALSDKILKARATLKGKYGSPEAQDFKDLLGADGMPLVSRQTKTLLMNLFLVMDNSEKEMMKNILQTPTQVESFLESFQRQPQDQDLLKNVRALIYDYDKKILLEQAREMAKNINKNRQMLMEQQRMKEIQQLRQLSKERQNTREHTR